MDRQALITSIREAGVVGQGGAGFPAHVKYDTEVETVIANGCECEPLLYTDQHVMLDRTADIVRAMGEVMRATGASRGVIGIKRKYTDVAAAFEAACQGTGIELAQLDNFYPAGDEHILVHEVTGRTIPPLGLPKEVGAVVANVGTLAAVADAMDGRGVTRKIVTVTGEVGTPAVLDVPIGTPISELIERCGGSSVCDPVVIMGGPMMGRFLDTAEAIEAEVITKTSGGIILLPRDHRLHRAGTLPVEVMQRQAATSCIQCRYCTDLCPRHLIGHVFETHKVMRAFSGAEGAAMGATQANLCCECGVCELFACPMGISPRRINAMLKTRFREEGVRYEGPRDVAPEQAALRSYRKVPVPRLAQRLDIASYMGLHPQYAGAHETSEVRIPLSQHIGAPARPTIAPGDAVKPGDLIGEIPENALGATVHASIAGVVKSVDTHVVIKGA